jgi:serine/threonine protein kinase
MSENLVGTKLGNYRLERLLGRGRMGVVFLARDEALLRPTAVKILSWSLPDPQGQSPEAWFISEARNVARVNHPHVVQIYSVARHGPHCFIAMEYVDGATADVWIERNGPFSLEQATELLIQAAGALQAAHDANVVHRDVKPENLLVGCDGKAKLGDFGMALHTAKAHPLNVGRAGTPYYTAPEIWNGDVASPASDIYALGATYYYLLTGHPPYVANDIQDLATAHLRAEIPEVRTRTGPIPIACQDIVKRCLAKSPRLRFPSAQAVGWEARALLKKMASVPPSASVTLNSTSDEVKLTPSPLRHSELPKQNGAYVQGRDWCEFLGLAQEPFVRCEPGKLPYRGEPHARVLASLETLFRDKSVTSVLLEGVEGSGRTTLAKELAYRLGSDCPCVHVDRERTVAAQSLPRRILRALGVSPSDANGARDLDVLVEHCLEARNAQSPCLLVLDDCTAVNGSLDELESVALAAQLTRSFRLLLLVEPSFEASWASRQAVLDGLRWEKLSLPALSAAEVSSYVDAWLKHAQQPGQPPILWTPDALLLLTRRSAGLPGNINRIVMNMLKGAVTRERRIVDSWDAWNGLQELGEACVSGRPNPWPSAEVLALLNDCRREAGIEPRR